MHQPPSIHLQPVRPLPARRRRVWPWLLAGTVTAFASCALMLVAWFAFPLIRATSEAGRAPDKPSTAFALFVMTFNERDDTGQRLAGRQVISSRRNQILKQRAEFLAEVEKTAHQYQQSVTFETGGPPDGGEPERVDINGDRATIAAYYRVLWATTGTRDTAWYAGTALLWRAEARKDGDGWRLWSITLPPWCDTNPGDDIADGHAKC